MRNSSIGTKLLLAFGGVFVLSFIAALVGWQGFQRVARTQNTVIDQAIPALRSAHEIAEVNALVTSASLSLARTTTELERKSVSTTLFQHVGALEHMLDAFGSDGFAAKRTPSLRLTVEEMAANLHEENNLVRQRLKQEKRIASLALNLIATTDQLNELADSLVANAAATTTAITSNLYDLVERDVPRQKLYDVFDRLVEVDIDGMERMYGLRLRSSNLRAFINQATRESDADALATLRQHSVNTLSILKRRVAEINDPQRRRTANTLLDAMELNNGPLYVFDIFESKLELLSINERLEQLIANTDTLSARLDRLVVELTQAGGSLIARVSVAARESLRSSRVWFGWSATFSLLLAIIVFWGYIKRNVIRRMLSLESATRAIAAGHYDVAVDVTGKDEVSRMAMALRTFRDNALEKRKVDEELLEYKNQLERLVRERTIELENTNQELGRVAREHAVARDRAEQANRAKTAFLATMSHELRTPLSGALGTIRLLQDTPLSAAQSEYVRTVTAATAALLAILNDILGYSQMEAGKLKLENKRFSLATLLNDIVGLMSASASEKGNRIFTDFGADLPGQLYGDAGKLHQILLNLIGNAIKFTENGAITVSARLIADASDSTHNCISFAVEDTGIGIDADKHGEVFRAFTQVDSSTAREHGGIGLGLAICERLVTALGGEIRLSSELGLGTSVSLTLRLRSAPPALAQYQTHTGCAAVALHVLVVEDDPTNCMVTCQYLQKLGHHFASVDSGKGALQALARNAVDVVLLDIGLPGMDGLSTLQHIRGHSAATARDTPVIAMSAHVFQEEVDQYMNAGMDGFLGKPFSTVELSGALDQAIEGVIAVRAKGAVTESHVLLDDSVVRTDLERLGAEQVLDMVDLFSASGTHLMSELLRGISQNDVKIAADVSHKLRGAASNFGLNKLCARLTAVELSSASNEPLAQADGEEVQALFEHSLRDLRALMETHAHVRGQRDWGR